MKNSPARLETPGLGRDLLGQNQGHRSNAAPASMFVLRQKERDPGCESGRGVVKTTGRQLRLRRTPGVCDNREPSLENPLSPGVQSTAERGEALAPLPPWAPEGYGDHGGPRCRKESPACTWRIPGSDRCSQDLGEYNWVLLGEKNDWQPIQPTRK